MLKIQELTDPNSCLNKALPEEMTFVLLGRDPAAPRAIREWIKERIRLGKNRPEDSQLKEAELVARQMEADHSGSRPLCPNCRVSYRTGD